MVQAASVQIQVSRVVATGTGIVNSHEVRHALLRGGCHTTMWAEALLERPECRGSSEGKRVLLMVLTTRELTGASERATIRQVFEGTTHLGLGMCFPEVGFQLRLQYLDQPQGESITIGMDAVADSGGSLLLFVVESREDGLFLTARDGHPDSFSLADDLWVFEVPEGVV